MKNRTHIEILSEIRSLNRIDYHLAMVKDIRNLRDNYYPRTTEYNTCTAELNYHAKRVTEMLHRLHTSDSQGQVYINALEKVGGNRP